MNLFLIKNGDGKEKIFKASPEEVMSVFRKYGPGSELYRLNPQLEAVQNENTDRQIPLSSGENKICQNSSGT